MRLQLAVLLLAACLAFTVSAEMPKHPFFGAQLAVANDYDDYGSTRLCLQAESICGEESDSDPEDNVNEDPFVVGLNCCKEGHYGHHVRSGDSGLDFEKYNAAGWCAFLPKEVDIPFSGTALELESFFTADCYLRSSTDECNLEDCAESVVRVEGIITREEKLVFDADPTEAVPKGGSSVCAYKNKKNKQTDGTNKDNDTAKAPAPTPPPPAPVEPTGLWEADAWVFHGTSTTYDAHSKLVGTGSFLMVVPTKYPSPKIISHEECGDRKKYQPWAIKTGVSPIKAGHYIK